jgi:mannose-6-phosphate isomerase-like protein (cupin superfamily)
MNTRRILALMAFVAAAGTIAVAQGSAAATYASHEKLTGCSSTMPIAAVPAYRVQCNVRSGPGGGEVHVKETDIFYILDGTATIVTGGTLLGAKSANDPLQIAGTGIQGGETRQLTKGDVLVIPAGTPHWFKEVPTSIQYFTVKSIQP